MSDTMISTTLIASTPIKKQRKKHKSRQGLYAFLFAVTVAVLMVVFLYTFSTFKTSVTSTTTAYSSVPTTPYYNDPCYSFVCNRNVSDNVLSCGYIYRC